MFEREYRELSDVPRWTIIRTIQKQNVAEHTFYVALYAGQVADAIEWVGNRARLLDAALRHDIEEMYTSDIPGPSKRMIVDDKSKYNDYCWTENQRRFGDDWELRSEHHRDDPDIWDIIKVADCLDECFFLATDQQLGNKAVQAVMENSLKRLQIAVDKLPRIDILRKTQFHLELQERIYAHRNEQSITPIG